MTEQIKQRADDYLKTQCLKRKDCLVLEMPDHYITDVKQAYIDGATENGIQWHDLRKDPNDLPKDTSVKRVFAGNNEYYRLYYSNGRWIYCDKGGYYFYGDVIAWCEEPLFKE